MQNRLALMEWIAASFYSSQRPSLRPNLRQGIDRHRVLVGLVLMLGFSGLQAAQVETYCIREDYTPHTDPTMVKFFDDHSEHHSVNLRKDQMYGSAREIALKNGYTRILDIGCGTGRRIDEYFSDSRFWTVGYDVPRIVDFANKYYPDRIWRVADFNVAPQEEFDLVVCINLIHHLWDPNQLMDWLAQIKCKKIIISTCDREAFEKMRQRIDIGPPMSAYNFREWSYAELENYAKRWFKIEQHFYSEPSFNQVLVCTK